jgi:hypothetical protein
MLQQEHLVLVVVLVEEVLGEHLHQQELRDKEMLVELVLLLETMVQEVEEVVVHLLFHLIIQKVELELQDLKYHQHSKIQQLLQVIPQVLNLIKEVVD